MKFHPSPTVLIFSGVAALAACSGSIEGQMIAPVGPEGPGGNGRTPGSNDPSRPGVSNPSAPADPNAAGPMPLRRLSRREYNNTVRELLGDTSRPADRFPTDRDEAFAFRRAGTVSAQEATLLRTAAESLAGAAVRKLPTLLPCDPATGEAACARKFIETFGLRAYRRPLAAAEIDRLVALYDAGRGALTLSFPDAIGLLIEAMLQSPAFLYHWEMSPGPAIREGAVVRLGPYDIASRLSYFLWGSMPDQNLFDAAAANKLATAADIEMQARRMVGDEKARETVSTFFEEWLEIDALGERDKDPAIYPQYNEALKTAMVDEARTFVEHVVFDGDGRWSTLLNATFSFVNQSVAPIYGVTSPRSPMLSRAELDPVERRGFLTQTAFLTLTGASDGSHPVRRGKEIYERILCRTLPPPPPDVPAPRPPTPNRSTRERFADHASDPCAQACHGLIDGLGFAFENYDGIGRYRKTDGGKPVDASGSVTLDGASKSFNNALDLTKQLAASEEVRHCLATQWVRFALVRSDVDADRASIDQAAAGFAKAESVRDLLVSVAASRSFRYRSPSVGEVLP